jgi:hypothetical protein
MRWTSGCVLVLALEFGEGRKRRRKSKRKMVAVGFGRGAAGCGPGVAACLHERRKKGTKRLFRMHQPGLLWAP